MRCPIWLPWIMLTVGLLMASIVQGAPVNADLSWEAPTAREDGTPLQAGDLAEYRIYYAVDGAEEVGPIVVTSGQSETVTIDLSPRPQPYAVRFEATAVDTDGRESARSNSVQLEFVVSSTAAPAPPTRLEFTITGGPGGSVEVRTVP